MKKAVVFDMDGVIVDSELYWAEADFSRLMPSVPGLTREALSRMSGMSFYDIYDTLKSEMGMTMGKKEFIGIFNGIAEDIYRNKAALLPGLLDFAASLRKDGFMTGVASSSPCPWIDIVMKRFELTGFFDDVVSADNVMRRSKPLPDIYVMAAERLGLKPERCVAIEDSEHGVASAKSAGMRCIGITGGTMLRHNLGKADLVVRGFSELSPGIVSRLGSL